MHRCLSIPANMDVPAILKTMKKKIKMMMVSLSRGRALNTACMSTFRPLIDEMVLRGLNTLNTLRVERSNADPCESSDKY